MGTYNGSHEERMSKINVWKVDKQAIGLQHKSATSTTIVHLSKTEAKKLRDDITELLSVTNKSTE